MSQDSLGDRMKQYEDASRFYLPRRLPLVIRLDGKAFHTYTRGLERPYDRRLMDAMDEVSKTLCQQVQNTVMAYTQSDEISLILVDYKDPKTTSWFDSNLQKMASVAAGIASAHLTAQSPEIFHEMRPAVFDARVFVLPPHEAVNYLIWRQQDWNRNSLAMLAQSLYSHKELQGKGRAEQHELCFQKGFNWADFPSHIKDGRVIVKREITKPVSYPKDGNVETVLVTRSEWHVRPETPVFVRDRDFVQHLIDTA